MIPATPVLVAREATLFLTADTSPPGEAECQLAEALARLAIQALRLRVVALCDHALLGRQNQVRVTPTLVIDTGTRRVQLVGEPASWQPADLERALARP